jgi:hypothetical protein
MRLIVEGLTHTCIARLTQRKRRADSTEASSNDSNGDLGLGW